MRSCKTCVCLVALAGCVARGPVDPVAEQRAAVHPPAQPTRAEVERWHERWARADQWAAESKKK